jgi:hypothetical protein
MRLVSGHIIDTDIDTDIGYIPISSHSVTDIVNCIPDIGVNIGTNIGMPDIGDWNNRYRCQYAAAAHRYVQTRIYSTE